MISDYTFKVAGEVARAVAVAVLAYAAAAIVEGGVPESRETWVALATGALPIIYAAIRAALTKSPIPTTPETPKSA